MDAPTNTVPSIEKEEEKSEMVVPSSMFLRRSRRRRIRRRKLLKTDFDSLPDDILMHILIRIPAQDIVDATLIAVSKKWNEMIRSHIFIAAHLHHPTNSGLLISNLDISGTTFISFSSSMTRADHIVISKFRYNFNYKFWSSCNGLMLDAKSDDKYELIITNPMTKQHFLLPPFIVRNQRPMNSSAIAYVATRMEYKVVRTYRMGVPVPKPRTRIYCAILTVGVDNSWRLVDTQHLSLDASLQLFMPPLVTEGFMHWPQHHHNNNHLLKLNGIFTEMSNSYVLTLNLETEIITQIPAPQCNGGYYYYKYFSGENYLSLLIGRGNLKWEVWEMKPKTGEWTKLPDIDLEAHKGLLNKSYDVEESALKPGDGNCLDCKLAPAGWLKYPVVIVFIVYRPLKVGYFRQARLRASYNVQTQGISLFSLEYHYHPYLAHKNSLVRIC